MNINIKGTGTSLTDADKKYINSKLEVLEKFVTESDKIFVEAELEAKHKTGLVFRLEITVNPPQYYAEARGNDFYEALDLAVPKIKDQLVKQKDKRISLRRRKTPLKNLK